MSRDERELVDAAAAGDRAAVDELFERHLPAVRAFVRLRAGSELRQHESCSDIVQSAVREVLENLDRFRYPGEGAFKSWLYATALRKIQKRRRHWVAEKRDARRNVAMVDASGDQSLLDCYRTFVTPGRQAVLREEVQRIESAFEKLSDEHREVITLAHVVGLSRAEIALQMGRSEGAVRVLLHRALIRISALLSGDESEERRTPSA